MQQEIEQTAKLDASSLLQLRAYLQTNLTSKGRYKRFMIRFFKEKVNVREPLDIRYKWTSGMNEIVIKKGAQGSQSRQETSIALGENNQLREVIQWLTWMNFKIGIGIYREIERFVNDTVEISLVKAFNIYFVEIEALERKNKKKALADITTFFKAINQTPLSKPEYQKYLRETDRNVNIRIKLDTFPKQLLASTTWSEILKMTGFEE